MGWEAALLNIGRKRRIVALAGRDDQSRRTLAQVGRLQAALRCSVQVVLVGETTRTFSQSEEVGRFCRWAGAYTTLELAAQDVVTCCPSTFSAHFERLTTTPPDLVVYPGSPDLSSAIATIPVHTLWSRLAPLNARLLLSRSQMDVRHVLVVSDGTERTLPVLQTAFELAEHFDVMLSHLDSRHVRVRPLSDRAVSRSGLLADDRSHEYMRAVHALLGTMSRAQRSARPNLLLVGAPARDGGGTTSAISASALPCSVLVVPV